MQISPCSHCAFKTSCEHRKGVVRRLPRVADILTTAITLKCPKFDNHYRPGRRVACDFILWSGLRDTPEFEGIDDDEEETFTATIMRYDRRKKKLRLWLDEPLQCGKKKHDDHLRNDGVIWRPTVWPDRVVPLDEPLDPVCDECGRPVRLSDGSANDWLCDSCGISHCYAANGGG